MRTSRDKLLRAGLQIIRTRNDDGLCIDCFRGNGWEEMLKTENDNVFYRMLGSLLSNEKVVVERQIDKNGVFNKNIQNYQLSHDNILSSGFTILRIGDSKKIRKKFDLKKDEFVILVKSITTREWEPMSGDGKIIIFDSISECRKTIRYMLEESNSTIED